MLPIFYHHQTFKKLGTRYNQSFYFPQYLAHGKHSGVYSVFIKQDSNFLPCCFGLFGGEEKEGRVAVVVRCHNFIGGSHFCKENSLWQYRSASIQQLIVLERNQGTEKVSDFPRIRDMTLTCFPNKLPKYCTSKTSLGGERPMVLPSKNDLTLHIASQPEAVRDQLEMRPRETKGPLKVTAWGSRIGTWTRSLCSTSVLLLSTMLNLLGML